MDEIVVRIFASLTGNPDVAMFEQELSNGTRLVQLDTSADVPLERSESPGAGDWTDMIFKPTSWSRDRWHQLIIKAPSFGDLTNQVDGYYLAQLIYDSFLTVSKVEICGQAGSVVNNGFTIVPSEPAGPPSASDVEVYQMGSKVDCALSPDSPGVANVAWRFTCEDVDWSREIEISVGATIAETPLRSLDGRSGYVASVVLPGGYVDQAKWCYGFPQALPTSWPPG